MSDVYKVREFAKRVGVSVITLRRWDRDGKLRAGRFPSKHWFYTEDHVRQVFGEFYVETAESPVKKESE